MASGLADVGTADGLPACQKPLLTELRLFPKTTHLPWRPLPLLNVNGSESDKGRVTRAVLCPFQTRNKKINHRERKITSMHPLIQLETTPQPMRGVFVLIVVVVACFGLSPTARAAAEGDVGKGNTVEGTGALQSLTTGAWNTAMGFQAMSATTTGSSSAAVGFRALQHNNGDYNTAVGSQALLNDTTGEGNIGIGGNAGVNITAGDDNIDIGNAGSVGDDGKIRIGRPGVQTGAFISGIYGVPVPNGLTVVIDAAGHLGTAGISSARFKDEIKPMDKASEAILALKPVTFHYKKEIDPKTTAQFGLVAEEVEKVNPALVARDAEGKVCSVRYEAVNAMLLNEFLKEHGKVEKLEATAAQQQKEIKVLSAALKEQASQIQKVSAQLEASKPAPQIVINNP